MKKLLVTVLLVGFGLWSAPSQAQSYREEIEAHRAHYKSELITSERSPLSESDLSYLRFFTPDSTYRIKATFKRTPGSQPFDMPTYSGIRKAFVKYGELHFLLHGNAYTLSVYRNLTLATIPQYRNHLFLPFKDLTNAQESYGGGRYMDLETTDIRNDSVILDFNKAYNPYCAYSDGYNCPIPPGKTTFPYASKRVSRILEKAIDREGSLSK